METVITLPALAQDTLQGLSANPKFLLPRYFYDDNGSKIFQDIMEMPEYYLTRCETEIFSIHQKELAEHFSYKKEEFDLIEFGSGDGSKTKILLHQLLEQNIKFRFIPIDISASANKELASVLGSELPDLNIEPQTGDYFEIMQDMTRYFSRRKVILFLGSNIGNFSQSEIASFLRRLEMITNPGDQVLIGFDLKKSPELIIQAYDDPHGHTRRFNLNLLHRLNRELGADFDTSKFVHHTTYSPVSGNVKSFLVSLTNQIVSIPLLEKEFRFKAWEALFMERSRKFDLTAIEHLALKFGFHVVRHFSDQKQFFADSLWIKK